MKKAIAFILTSAILLSYTGHSVYAEEIEEPAENAEETIVEEEASAPEEVSAPEETPASEEASSSEEAPASEEVPAPEEVPVPEETSASEESQEIVRTETAEAASASEENQEIEEEETVEAAPIPEENQETEEEITPLITLNSLEEEEQINKYDVQISWSVTEGDLSIESTYKWNPDNLRYEKTGEELVVNTAPGVDITIQNNSNVPVSYVIEPRFTADFGDQPQAISGTIEAYSSDVISGSLEITRVPDGYDGSGQIASYQISVYK